MSTLTSSEAPLLAAPRLRLVHGMSAHDAGIRDHDEDRGAMESPTSEQSAHVLVVGAHTGERLRMLDELRGLLPVSTPFVEAHETWEVLARAAGSRMVVLTGDLGDVSAASLVRLLSRRHPTLPVVSVGGATRAAPPGDVGAAFQ